MGLYGSGIYGISTYGDSKSINYNIGFTAHTVDYRTVNLSWKTTDVDSTDTVYAWKIIKTIGGAPDYPNQGQLVAQLVDTTPFAGKSIAFLKTITDIDAVFPSSSIITYSFWALISYTGSMIQATWKLLGAADAVIVDNNSDDTTLRILRLLPGAWTSHSAESLGEPDTDTKLYNFVGAFGFYYDKLRAEAGALNDLSDYRKFPKELLPAAVLALGFTYEPKLGDSFHRSLYKNGHLINSLKGTYLGINNYIKSLTHFKSMISVGRNLMLDYLQSSFEGSVGTWTKVGTSGFTAGSRAANALTSPTLGLSGSYLSDGYGILTKTSITISSLTTNAYISSGTIVDATTWTVTTATAHGFVVGDSGSIAGVHPTQFNTSFTVDSVINSTKFTITSGIDEYATITASHTSGAATATITLTAHGLVTGDQVTISGSSLPAQFLNTFTITRSNANVFTIPIATGTAIITSVAGVSKAIITGGTATIGNPFILSYSSPEVTNTTTKTFLVIPGTPYLFSGWALIKSGSATGITVQAQIQWFDAQGNLLSSATAGSTVNPTAWTKFESSSTYAAIFAPTKAIYAGVKVTTTGMAATDTLYLDNFMFSVYPGLIGNKDFGSGDAIYEDAKNIIINLEGYRTNLISNPGFEDSVGFWNAKNGTLLSDTSPITTLMVGSTNVCTFTSTTGASSAIYTNWIRNIKPSKEYTFSAYVLAPANGITATANIEWDMPQSITNQTSISTTSSVQDKYRPTINKKISSSSTIVNNSSWTRISVTATAPDFISFNGFPSAMVSIEFTTTAGSEVWYLDCALFEEAPSLNTYFQGNGGIIPSTSIPAGGTISSIITDDLIPVGDTAWETKARTNFLYNPGFESGTADGWYDTSSPTLSFATIVTSIKKFGNNSAQIPSLISPLTIATDFRFPVKVPNGSVAAFPTGGERITGSAYITHGCNNPIKITTTLVDNTSGISQDNIQIIPGNTAGAGNWYRVHCTSVVSKPTSSSPSMTLKFKIEEIGGPSSPSVYFDGAQAELGSYPTTYINNQADLNSVTVTIPAVSSTVTGISKNVIYSNTFDSGTISNTTLGAPSGLSSRTDNTSTYYTAGHSLQLSSNSGSSVMIPVQAPASPYWSPVSVGRSYSAWGHFAFSSGSAVTDIQAVLNWYNSSGTLLSSSSGSTTNRTAATSATGVGTAGSNVITGSAGAFSNVFVGNGVSKTGYIPEGTYVTAVASTQITISQNVTTSWASAGFSPWIVPTVTATAPSGAAYVTLSFTYTTGGTNTVLILDSVAIQDNGRTKYTTSTAHNLAQGDVVTITGITPSGFNVTTYNLYAIDSSTTFTLLNNTTLFPNAAAPTFSSATVTSTNSGTQYTTNSIMNNIGRSYYWPNIDLKYSRLLNTIVDYLPIGSTSTVIKGVPSEPKNESVSSLVPSYSFENNLYGWSGLTNNTISRYVSAGSQGSVQGVNSASWLVATNVIDTNAIGASAGFHVSPGTLYQFAANLMAPTASSGLTSRRGVTRLDVSWYTDSTLTTLADPAQPTNNIHTGATASANAENRWAFLSGSYASPTNAFYAVLKVSYLPTSGYTSANSSNCVYIDDVVCSPL